MIKRPIDVHLYEYLLSRSNLILLQHQADNKIQAAQGSHRIPKQLILYLFLNLKTIKNIVKLEKNAYIFQHLTIQFMKRRSLKPTFTSIGQSYFS